MTTKFTDAETKLIAAIVAALPVVTGSEKQVAYANDIIRRSAEWATQTTFGSALRKAADVDAYCAKVAGCIQESDKLMITDAKRWIEASAAHAGRRIDISDIANGRAKL